MSEEDITVLTHYRPLTKEETDVFLSGLHYLQIKRHEQSPNLDCSGKQNPDIKALRKSLQEGKFMVLVDQTRKLTEEQLNALRQQAPLDLHVNQLEGAVKELKDSVADLEATFHLRHLADMRAIKRWRAAHPGKELVMPDHADLVVWLMKQYDALLIGMDAAISDSEFASSGGEAHQKLVKLLQKLKGRTPSK